MKTNIYKIIVLCIYKAVRKKKHKKLMLLVDMQKMYNLPVINIFLLE